MVRNRLCLMGNVQMTLRPFSRNRDAYGRHISLCAVRTDCGHVSRRVFSRLAAFELRAFIRWQPHKDFFEELRRKTGANSGDAGVHPERRAWSSAEELNRGKEPDLGDAPSQAQSINALPFPARVFRAGRGRGEWGQRVFGRAVR